MSRQLDILAIEPYHGGARREMLEAILRYSRHRWRILKLPARKMHRRLLVSSMWFSETLSRNGIGRADVIFASEALNLADFLRLRPELGKKPSVVYFHDNQLPLPQFDIEEKSTDLVNLNSAMAAHEIWFNSLFHLRTFLSRASGMVARHEELQMRNPMSSLMAKAHLMLPPIDLAEVGANEGRGSDRSKLRKILVDARGSDSEILCEALRMLREGNEAMEVTVIGGLKDLPVSVGAARLSERDLAGHTRALLSHGILISARACAFSDELAVRALAAGCHPIVQNGCVYPEILPEAMQELCLHDGSAESIVGRVSDVWRKGPPRGMEFLIDEVLGQFDAIGACRVIDERLDALAGAKRAAGRERRVASMA